MVVQELSKRDLWRLSLGADGTRALGLPGWGSIAPATLIDPGVPPFVLGTPSLENLTIRLGSNAFGILQWRVEDGGVAGFVAEPFMRLDRAITLRNWMIFRRARQLERYITAVSTANPAVITLNLPHQVETSLATVVRISGGSGAPSLNGSFVATQTGAKTLSLAGVDNSGGTAVAYGRVLLPDYEATVDDPTPPELEILGDDAGITGIAIAQGRIDRDYKKKFFDVYVPTDSRGQFWGGAAPIADDTTSFAVLRWLDKGQKALITQLHVSPGTSTESHIEKVQLQAPVQMTDVSDDSLAEVTLASPHGFSSGTFLVYIKGNVPQLAGEGDPGLDGVHLATHTGANTFTIPVDNSGGGAVIHGEVYVEVAPAARVTLCKATGGKAFTGKVEAQVWAGDNPAIIVAKNVKSGAGAGTAYASCGGTFVDALDASKFYAFAEEKAADGSGTAVVFATLRQNVAADGPVLIERVALCGNPAGTAGVASAAVGIGTSAAGANFQAIALQETVDPDEPQIDGSWLDEVGTGFILLRHDNTGDTGGQAVMAAISGRLLNAQ